MTPLRVLAVTALAGLLTACGADPEPAAGARQETASAEQAGSAALDDGALHALLVAHGDDLIPSDWNTGEPVSESSMAYWVLPQLDVTEARSSACTPLPEPANAYDCTLSFTAEPGERNRRPITASFRFDVQEGADGDLILLSPNVRWAVTG